MEAHGSLKELMKGSGSLWNRLEAIKTQRKPLGKLFS